jgi:hypothetical protein
MLDKIIKFVEDLFGTIFKLFKKKMDFKDINICVSQYRTIYILDKIKKGEIYYDSNRNNFSKKIFLKNIDNLPCLNTQYLIKNKKVNRYEIPDYNQINFDDIYENEDYIFETNIEDLYKYILIQLCSIIEINLKPINLTGNTNVILTFDIYKKSTNEIKKILIENSYKNEYDTIKDIINYYIDMISRNTNTINGYKIGNILELRQINLLKLK